MTSASAARMPRLLALVPYFLARPGVDIAEAARDFGVSAKQLRKDLELLWMCGLPGYGPGDLIDLSFAGNTVTVTFDAGMSRPLRLTGGEATSLLVALRALAETPGVLDVAAIERAIVKIETAAGQAQPQGVVVGNGVREAARTTATRGIVQEALNTRHALAIRYYTESKDEMSERTVDPIRLLIVDGRGYLEGWCRRVEGVRLFRLDRIDRVQVLDEIAVVPDHVERRDVTGGVFAADVSHSSAVLVLETDARWVSEFYGCHELAELPGGRLRVSMQYGDPSRIVRLVLGLGGSARLESPTTLVEEIVQRAAAAIALMSRPVVTPVQVSD